MCAGRIENVKNPFRQTARKMH